MHAQIFKLPFAIFPSHSPVFRLRTEKKTLVLSWKRKYSRSRLNRTTPGTEIPVRLRREVRLSSGDLFSWYILCFVLQFVKRMHVQIMQALVTRSCASKHRIDAANLQMSRRLFVFALSILIVVHRLK